jgi:L-malate glycosyltransferase
MKIAQVTGFFMPKNYGSNELFIARELSKRGHNVTVFTTAQPPPEYEMLKENSVEKSTEFYEGFTIKRIPSALRIRDVQVAPEFFQALLNEKFDIIHAHEFFSPSSFYSSLVSVIRRTPLVITQHNDHLPLSFISKNLYYADAITIGQLSLKQAKKIIALTTAIKNHLLFFGAANYKIQIIPNAVDTTRFRPSEQNLLKDKWNLSSPIVLYVGRFSTVKGIKTLLKAFPTVIEAFPEVKLMLVGGGPLEPEIKEYEKHFSGHIYSLPFIPNDVMPNIYPGCDIVVLPSLEERFGNVALEAMACGKPVVGSGIGGMLDTIVHEQTGLHVQPGNIKQLSDSLIRLLRNENFRTELGQNARKRVLREYSSEVVIKKVEQLYVDVIS